MGFLDSAGAKLAEKLPGKAEDLAEKWLDKGVAKLRTDVVPILPGSTQGAASAVADMLATDRARNLVGDLTHRGVTEMVGYLALGADEEAHFVWLREKASFNEAQDALKAAMREAYDEAVTDAAKWEETKKFLLELLAIGVKVAVPLILAMI